MEILFKRSLPLTRTFYQSQFMRRMLFVQTSTTPNPLTLKFSPGKTVAGESPMDFSAEKYASISPLAMSLFQVGGVQRVFYGRDFISVTKEADLEWPDLKPEVLSLIEEHFESPKALFTEDPEADDLEILDTDSEAV
jgi:hypothetical protein